VAARGRRHARAVARLRTELSDVRALFRVGVSNEPHRRGPAAGKQAAALGYAPLLADC